jgi:hypothetical protein
MSKEIEIGIIVGGTYLTVSGTYHPEEPTEWYDGNMSGHPGYAAEFELASVKVEDVEIIDIISDEIYDEIIDKVIENQQN